MPAYDTLYRSQAYTSIRKLACPVQALEGTEELAGVSHFETYSVVSHEIRGGAIEFCESELYAHLRLAARKTSTRCAAGSPAPPSAASGPFCHDPVLRDKFYCPFGVAPFELFGKVSDYSVLQGK